MKLYHVCVPPRPRIGYCIAQQVVVAKPGCGALVAYEGDGKATIARVMDLHAQSHAVLLDSGAFGAWRSGHPRSLERYIEVVRALAPIVDAYASLDVIGDWRATLANHEHMLAEGLDPVPTYHFGEPDEALDAILALQPKYIGFGGLVGRSKKVRREWLDPVWSRLVRTSNWPIRVHGWGVTDMELVPRYPWYSVDSSSAMSAGRGGGNARRGVIATDHSQAGKHGLTRVRQTVDRIEELVKFASEKWTSQGLVW